MRTFYGGIVYLKRMPLAPKNPGKCTGKRTVYRNYKRHTWYLFLGAEFGCNVVAVVAGEPKDIFSVPRIFVFCQLPAVFPASIHFRSEFSKNRKLGAIIKRIAYYSNLYFVNISKTSNRCEGTQFRITIFPFFEQYSERAINREMNLINNRSRAEVEETSEDAEAIPKES